jgi:putative membrane protein
MMYGYGPCGFMMGPWSILIWLVVLAIIILAVYLMARSARQTGPGESPLDILKARYAKGEITKEEFDQMKRDLGL